MATNPRLSLAFAVWLGYLAFVVYGSLVPLDFKPIPFDQAWLVFLQTPMYELGLESRADWIANGVLYVPVGFLTAHMLLQRSGGRYRAPLLVLTGLFAVALALAVEFTQIFFPPRTVSRNDLLAECIGGVIGLLLATKYSEWFKSLLHSLLGKPQRLALRLAEAYLFGYVAFSLFPYDVLLSAAEIAQKYRGGGWAWFLAGDEHGRLLALLKLASEAFLTLPFGLYLGYRSMRRPATLAQAALLGMLLGGFIEGAQFFIASGVSQGLSVVTRVAGVCAGLALWQRHTNWMPEKIMALIRRHALLLGPAYLLALLLANGWFTYSWMGSDHAVAQLREVHFLPFYYHYFTTEAKALFSLASVCLMYLPIGALTWAGRGSPAVAFALALVAATLVEAGKLFLQGMHPDPTNIILATLANWGFVHLADTLATAISSLSRPGPDASPSAHALRTTGAPNPEDRIPAAERPVSRAPHAALWTSLAVTAYGAATFPTQPLVLCLVLAACAAVLWRRPVLLVAIAPAALPLLDLAPWSGRFFLDEFDLLLLVGISIAYTRAPPVPSGKRHPDMLFTAASLLLAISLAASAMRGLLPWHMPDANAFTNYYSPFNALRVAKGALWAFLLYGLLPRFASAGHDVCRLFAIGMAMGVAGTVLVILWERITFPGLFNFADVYRVTGPFSQMHVGGADIETYLTIGAPFLVLLLFAARSFKARMACGLLLLAASYGVMVTFSRAGYAGYGIAFTLAVVASTAKRSADGSSSRLKRSIPAIVLSLAVLGVVTPIFYSEFAQERMSSVAADLDARRTHWNNALAMRDPGPLTSLLGMGLGRYPETHYWRSDEARASSYWLGEDAENAFLKLGTGSAMYIEQFVSVEPGTDYSIELKARSNAPESQITLAICEKWLLTSARCSSQVVNFNGTGKWQTFQVRIPSGEVGKPDRFASRPVKFSFYNTSQKATVDLDDIRMTSDVGGNLLKNGDFSKNLDHWFFSVDNDLPWHIWSLPIQVFFDQGWLGVIAFGFFVLFGLWRAGQERWRGNAMAGIFLAAGTGFVVIGTLDSLVDSPRLLLLSLLLIAMCWNSAVLSPPRRGQ